MIRKTDFLYLGQCILLKEYPITLTVAFNEVNYVLSQSHVNIIYFEPMIEKFYKSEW